MTATAATPEAGSTPVPPVLLLVFNRPEHTRRVMEVIRRARPSRLYVAADGPSSSNHDVDLCEATRAIALDVDWPCDVMTLLRPENLGCRAAVSEGISWFFEHETEGIVLEDDCVPHETFFAYCQELLTTYRDDPRVMCISGSRLSPEASAAEGSYSLARTVGIWGWASWRRAWDLYDLEMSSWPADRRGDLLRRINPDDRGFRTFWRTLFDQAWRGRIDTWDYQWVYACWRHGGLTAIPRRNLVQNIGSDHERMTARDARRWGWMSAIPTGPLELPLRHPPRIERDSRLDEWYDLRVYRVRHFGALRIPRAVGRRLLSIVGYGRGMVRAHRLGRALFPSRDYAGIEVSDHRALARLVSKGSFARAIVVEDFLTVVLPRLPPSGVVRVAVVGGSGDEPEALALRALGRELRVTLLGVEGDVEHLDLNDEVRTPTPGRHDLVLCSQVFEHIWNHRQAAQHLRDLADAGAVVWLATPASNRPHGLPDYYVAGMTDEYLRQVVAGVGLVPIAAGRVGTRRLYECLHTLPTWLTVRGHAFPPLFVFREHGGAAGLALSLRYLLRTVALLAVSGKPTRDIRTATESWVLAMKP
jgi:hypothetical protein